MTVDITNGLDDTVRSLLCEQDGLYFNRYFFKQRFGSKMLVNRHHHILQKTLEKVYNGQIKRLIINIPPGYTKTEQAVINFIARGLAKNAGARFLHLSYSHNLALLNSSTARNLVKSQAFQKMWPMKLRDDTDSKALWWTEKAGGVYATSSNGQVTGFRAGHMDEGKFTGALLLDDPVKPNDAFSEVLREGVNTAYNETIKSRLAIENVPVIVIMQRIHYNDLSGYLLRGGSGEKWHHLLLPVLIDNSKEYPQENTHGIEIAHDLPNGWLWTAKHNDEHLTALQSHKRTFAAQYMQAPKRFEEEGALWNEKLISLAKALRWNWLTIKRTVVAIDPATSSSDSSDETGIVVASEFADKLYSVDGDYSGRFSPMDWAKKAIRAYNDHNADCIVIETNQGGDMAENTLRQAGFDGRIIRIHASKGKFARAEPISVLYERGQVAHRGNNLFEVENQMMEYVPATATKSPDRLDALVYALTELSEPSKGRIYA